MSRKVKFIDINEINLQINGYDDATKALYLTIYAEYVSYSMSDLKEAARRMGIPAVHSQDKVMLAKAMTDYRFKHIVYGIAVDCGDGDVSQADIKSVTDDYMGRTAVLFPISSRGVVDIQHTEAWLRDGDLSEKPTDVFIPMIMVNEFNLRSGDEISGQARQLQDSGRMALFNIEFINGAKPKQFKRGDYADGVHSDKAAIATACSPSLDALVNSAPIYLGQRKIVVGVQAYNLDEMARELSKKLSERGLDLINVFLDDMPELSYLTRSLVGITTSLSTKDFDQYDRVVSLATETAKRMASQGKDVAVVLNGVDGVSQQTLRFLLGAGGYTKKGSVTVIVFASSYEVNQNVNGAVRATHSTVWIKGNPQSKLGYDIVNLYSNIPPRQQPPESYFKSKK